jgi:hypothetical protein
MPDWSGLLLVTAVAAVGVLLTIVPDHWMPITLLARQRGWWRVETARVAFQAGAGHVGTTLVLGLIVWLAGVAVAERFGQAIHSMRRCAVSFRRARATFMCIRMAAHLLICTGTIMTCWIRMRLRPTPKRCPPRIGTSTRRRREPRCFLFSVSRPWWKESRHSSPLDAMGSGSSS